MRSVIRNGWLYLEWLKLIEISKNSLKLIKPLTDANTDADNFFDRHRDEAANNNFDQMCYEVEMA
jgi:hypothetical protein